MLKAYTLAILAIAPEGGGSLIDVNPGLIVWTVVTFIFLLIVLRKFAWKPILSALNQREVAIKESLEKAEKAKEEAQKILQENQASLQKAEEESKKIVEQSRTYAEKLKDQIIKESKQQAQKIIDDASSEIGRKKDEAFNDLKNQIAEIVIQTSEKILAEKMDKDSHKKLVDRYINEIERN